MQTESDACVHIRMFPATNRRRVDRLGRVGVPAKVRRELGIELGEDVNVTAEGDHIVLERRRPKCLFCSAPFPGLEYKGTVICSDCATELRHRANGATRTE